jgi:hypothetical protein
MPPTTRRTGRRAVSSSVQAAALSMRGRGTAPSTMWDSDEDYDSEDCAGMPMPERVSSKLRSAVHRAWVDLEDRNGYFPHDNMHDIATVEPTLESLAEFLVEVEESIIWWRESDPRYAGTGRTDAQTLAHIYRALKTDDRPIGTRMVLELKMICDTYVVLYRGARSLDLATDMEVRPRRTSSRADARATRTQRSEQTTGEALVQRLEALKFVIDAALSENGEHF